MFNDKYGLTQAVLDGRKTMTRREIKYDGKIYNKAWKYHDYYPSFKDALLKYSLYKIGEVVAIAQNYRNIMPLLADRFNPHANDWMRNEKGYKNKMFVKAELMPHHIRITNIRVERLQDISDVDCMREGIFQAFNNTYSFIIEGKKRHIMLYDTPKDAFSILIDKVGKRDTWKNNPWVYVYEFELIN